MSPMNPDERSGVSWQATFDDLGQSLAQATFVVLDLETSGGSPAAGAGITEIGAVKVCGGEVIGEFQSFINPGMPIPAFITVLTGITDSMVANAPTIQNIFPTLLEFLGSPEENILVAHNAGFDLGFLKAAASANSYPWPHYKVLDTVRLARSVLSKEEVRDCKLSTLSAFFGATTQPNHRALDDARATRDVLHGIIERLGSFGITSIEELTEFSHHISKAQLSKKHLAVNIPASPGVYIFRNQKGEALYVGTSKNLRSRVRNYFTASETRKRMHDMLALTNHIDTVICPTVLEAQIRELRMINEHQPRFNRRSRTQEKAMWVKLTGENFPRLSIVRGAHTLKDDEGWMGPFSGALEAQLAIDALHDVVSLRQCTPRITQHSVKNASPCALFDMHKCGAPCIGAQSGSEYLTTTSASIYMMVNNPYELILNLDTRMRELSLNERFEEAAEIRNRLNAFIRGSSRGQRIRALTRVPEIIVANRKESTQWEFLCIRFGRLTGSTVSNPGIDLGHTIESLRLASEIVAPNDSILPASTYEEVEKLLSYLEIEPIRIVSIQGQWVSPVFGAASTQFNSRQIQKRYEADNRWLSSAHLANS